MAVRVRRRRYDPPVTETPMRTDRSAATRARIAEVALELFVSQGYAETTIDQIAAAADLGRRTVFRHFPTKEAMLIDHLVLRREEAIERLRHRPASEPLLASLLTVLRELAVRGYDRRLLAQIRAVLASQPGLVGEEIWGGSGAFAVSVVETLQAELGDRYSPVEIHALSLMAMGWFLTAAHTYLVDNRESLATCFDEVVTMCVKASSTLD
jgi:AcrR family transcriptional regulator